ncbi:hypothetical protein GCM10022221_69240 [Actinocorallia aurea]
MLAAACATGTTILHPGYGFLSEDAAFARAVEDAGISFAGPSPAHLDLFGAKHTAREAAQAACVPLLPGTGLLAGGIGMRACRSADELAEAWDGVQRTAAANFATAGVFVERLVEGARHVEVQVFGDGAGRVVAFGDRDCSLQRRNQKVFEEAPAFGLPDAVRELLRSSAVRLCASVGYRSAGTAEYVYDPVREEAYFLEVNTRLQVEHPVTEAVYGVDLVEWMLRPAQGTPRCSTRGCRSRAAMPSRPACTRRTRRRTTGRPRDC